MPQAPHQLCFADQKLQILARHLSPENPIRSTEFLRGRTSDLQNIEQELRFFRAIPFIFGNRGVGKTSLARTAAQLVTPSDREHISESIQQLRMSYESATQRHDDIYKHLIWALADSDVVDLRIDDWTREYRELAARQLWSIAEDSRISYAMSRLNQPEFGRIVANTPIRYGSRESRYRYKRFSNNLMKGHVRLQAENEGIQLGAAIHL